MSNAESRITDDDIPQKLRERVAESDFESVLKFDCGDDGVLVIDHKTVLTEDKPADCTITAKRQTLEKLMRGELSPANAFLTGKIKVEGDMSVAMSLQKLL